MHFFKDFEGFLPIFDAFLKVLKGFLPILKDFGEFECIFEGSCRIPTDFEGFLEEF